MSISKLIFVFYYVLMVILVLFNLFLFPEQHSFASCNDRVCMVTKSSSILCINISFCHWYNWSYIEKGCCSSNEKVSKKIIISHSSKATHSTKTWLNGSLSKFLNPNSLLYGNYYKNLKWNNFFIPRLYPDQDQWHLCDMIVFLSDLKKIIIFQIF